MNSINIYYSEKMVFFIASHVGAGGVLNFSKQCKKFYINSISFKVIEEAILWVIADIEKANTSEYSQDEFEILGFKNYSDFFKKTNLIELRITNGVINIFLGKKIKKWYEFDSVDNCGYSLNDDASIERLSTRLVDLLSA